MLATSLGAPPKTLGFPDRESDAAEGKSQETKLASVQVAVKMNNRNGTVGTVDGA